jgi:hypothetical protein
MAPARLSRRASAPRLQANAPARQPFTNCGRANSPISQPVCAESRLSAQRSPPEGGPMLGWFDAREAKAFGTALANEFIRQVEPARNLPQSKFAKKADAALAQIARDTAEFRKTHPLNVYKRAQLTNQFKWAMKDAGYDDEYVDKLTDWLVLKL